MAELHALFDRIDVALASLTDSITSYNPSLAAATTFNEVEIDLDAALDRLTAQQHKYAELKYLQATEQYLDERVKNNLRLLADTRRDLIHNTPVSLPVENAVPVDTDVLLAFAQRISKQTMPQLNVQHDAHQPESSTTVDVPQIKTEDASPLPMNGISSLEDNINPPTDSHLQSRDDLKGRASEVMDESQKAYLRQEDALAFTPWPAQYTIKQGALQKIQEARDNGQDPSTMDLSAAASSDEHDQDPAVPGTNTQQPATIPPAGRSEAARAHGLPAKPPAPVADDDFDEFDLYKPGES